MKVAFSTSEGFWLGLQADYDLEEAREAIKGQLKDIERIAA
jgi:antitoxin HigA-1